MIGHTFQNTFYNIITAFALIVNVFLCRNYVKIGEILYKDKKNPSVFTPRDPFIRL